jgi:lysophospholipase L1-like esterase
MLPARAALMFVGFIAALAAVPAQARSLRIVALGTSITHSVGWPADLKRALAACGVTAKVAMIAKGGATSAWGIEQLPKVRAERPDYLTVEFAINDALGAGGVPLAQSRANLAAIVAAVPRGRAVVIITNRAFRGHATARPDLPAYYQGARDVAAAEGDAVADPAWSSLPEDGTADGLHPTREAAEKLLVPLLARIIDPRC